mgnify:CR=1 FL=1|tara:strand:+ start:52 stop:318 length:267 start_codon:yes stop_codon:yes gene_type:complete
MASTLKLLGSEVTLSTTANNVGRAKIVRVLNTDTTARLVTVKSGVNTIGTITLAPSEVQNIMKLAAETLEVASAASTKVKAVSIAYTN